MLKYVESIVTFCEFPDEISLCLNISNCPCHCTGCHSQYLADDIGELLTQRRLQELLKINDGISCIGFMGGDSEPYYINILAKQVKETTGIKVGWYSGRDELSDEIDLKWFDYIKLGGYKREFGPLNDIHTNQKMYQVIRHKTYYELRDITSKFWKL